MPKKVKIPCNQSPRNFFNVTPIQVTFPFVIVVDGIDNVFLAVLDDLPDGSSDHVTRRNWGDAQAFALAFEKHGLFSGIKGRLKHRNFYLKWCNMFQKQFSIFANLREKVIYKELV